MQKKIREVKIQCREIPKGTPYAEKSLIGESDVDIDLLSHKYDRGTSAERIIDEMMEKQTTNVDVVSGATNSSKVIRKAVENAMLGA